MAKGNKQKKTKKAVSGKDETELVAAMLAEKSDTQIPDEFAKDRADLPLDVGFVAQVPFITGGIG